MGDGFYQALAHPIRREIIRLLKWSDLSAGEIANNFNISKPSISRHLEVLKKYRNNCRYKERKSNNLFS